MHSNVVFPLNDKFYEKQQARACKFRFKCRDKILMWLQLFLPGFKFSVQLKSSLKTKFRDFENY